MPLILLCGYPCSGKTLVAEKLAEELRKRRPDCDVEIVSEEAIARTSSTQTDSDNTGDPRIPVYSTAALEKQLRSQLKSQVSWL